MAAEIIEAKQCPKCKKVYTFLKFKYNAGALIGGYVAVVSLFLFTILLMLLKPFIGLVLGVSCYMIYRQSSKVAEVEEKRYYWYCYKCDADFHDTRLAGTTLFRSQRPSRSKLITQSVKEKIDKDAKKKAA
ncbi:MAG: hypothetical protein HQK84_12720 [Nitrospinae bacterium]|nr:hypothetical protein [Nitrospinota bacterium]